MKSLVLTLADEQLQKVRRTWFTDNNNVCVEVMSRKQPLFIQVLCCNDQVKFKARIKVVLITSSTIAGECVKVDEL